MNKILKMLNYKTKWIDDSGYTPTYTGAFNFMNGASQSNEYTYDKNGNLTKDLNKNISSIQYNFLNLPAKYYLQFGQVCRIHLRCQWPETANQLQGLCLGDSSPDGLLREYDLRERGVETGTGRWGVHDRDWYALLLLLLEGSPWE